MTTSWPISARSRIGNSARNLPLIVPRDCRIDRMMRSSVLSGPSMVVFRRARAPLGHRSAQISFSSQKTLCGREMRQKRLFRDLARSRRSKAIRHCIWHSKRSVNAPLPNQAIDNYEVGWGGRIRTSEWRDQNPLPYHLATPQRLKIELVVEPRGDLGRLQAASCASRSSSGERFNPRTT